MSDVKFIRRNGRIIPIGGKGAPKKGVTKPEPLKKSSLSTATKKGLVFVGAGIATALLANYGAGKLLKKGAEIGAKSVGMTKSAKLAFGASGHTTALGKKVGEILLKGSVKQAKTTGTALKFSQGLRWAGGIVSGVLLGEGIAEVARGQKKKQLTIKEEVGTQLAGFAAASAGAYAFKKGASSPLIRKLLSRGKL